MSTEVLMVFTGAVSIGLGLVVFIFPERAAATWAPEYLKRLTAASRKSLLRRYQVFGLLLILAGVLLIVDSVWFWT